MTDEMMNLRTLVEKTPDADLLREISALPPKGWWSWKWKPDRAAYGEKNPERLAQRNGYRNRIRETRAGAVELRIPPRVQLTNRSPWSHGWGPLQSSHRRVHHLGVTFLTYAERPVPLGTAWPAQTSHLQATEAMVHRGHEQET